MPIEINYKRCVGCGACYRECPADCIAWDGERDLPYQSYPGECWHCGICELECKVQAVDVRLPLSAYGREVDRRFLG